MRFKMLLVGMAIGTCIGAAGTTVLLGGPIRFALTVLLLAAVVRHLFRRLVARTFNPHAAAQPACAPAYAQMTPMYPSFHADYHLLPARFLRVLDRCSATPTTTS